MRKSNLHPVAHPNERHSAKRLPAGSSEIGRSWRGSLFSRDAPLNGCFGVHCFGARLAPSRGTANAVWVTLPTAQSVGAPRIGSRPKRRLFRRWRQRSELAYGAVGVNRRHWLARFNLVLITRSGVPPWARRLPRATRGSPMPAGLP